MTAAALGCRGVARRKKKQRDGGEKEMTLGPIYKVKGGGDRREKQGAGILDT